MNFRSPHSRLEAGFPAPMRVPLPRLIDCRRVLYYSHLAVWRYCGRDKLKMKQRIRVLENSMPKKSISIVALVFFVEVVLPGATLRMRAQTTPAPYAAAAPLNQYFMADDASEVALARSAAPASVADGAEVLVLRRDGYRAAAKGGNGFTCLVMRSWAKTTDDPEFWNPKVKAPICVNAPAAKTYLPLVLMKTNLVLAGKSRLEIMHALKSALDGKDIAALEPDAMCYMMSSHQYLSDDDMAWHPHMMWFVPGDSEKTWGANLPGVPAMAGYVAEDRMTVFMVVVDHWSDGTPVPHAAH
jgi:hypothetical protein